MVYIHYCKSCEEGRHGDCSLSQPAPEGYFGGALCRCPCRGNPNWNTPEFIEAELKKALESIADHQRASEEIMQNSPKKIRLKDP